MASRRPSSQLVAHVADTMEITQALSLGTCVFFTRKDGSSFPFYIDALVRSGDEPGIWYLEGDVGETVDHRAVFLPCAGTFIVEKKRFVYAVGVLSAT